MGENPYELSCETPCRNGQTEEDGLCVGEAIIPCVDEEDNCAAWQKMGECDNNPDFMETSCRKSCKICTSETEEGSETDETPEKGSETGGSTEEGSETGGSTNDGAQTGGGSESGKCNDDNEHCVAWAATNQCHVNPGYMMKKCKKSCGVCKETGTSIAGPDEECVDKNENCEEWAANNQCKVNPGYMYIDCKNSCGLC